MKRNFRKGGKSIEELLQAALELMAWQAELIRTALAKASADPPADQDHQPDSGLKAGD